MIKNLIVAAFLFTAGFFAHALFFPNFIPAIQNTSAVQKENNPNTGNGTESSLFTHIAYDGSAFSAQRVIIQNGYYIAITNTSKDKLMWIASDYPGLETKRGYGQSERLELILYQKGSYVVADKLNRNATFTLIVE